MIHGRLGVHHDPINKGGLLARQDRRVSPLRIQVAQRILDQHEADEGPTEFAKRIGVDAGKLGNWKERNTWKAKSGVDLATIMEIHRKIGWSLHWLLTGEGTREMPAPDVDAYLAGLREGLGEVEAATERITSRLERAEAEKALRASEELREAEKDGEPSPRRRASSGRGRRRP